MCFWLRQSTCSPDAVSRNLDCSWWQKVNANSRIWTSERKRTFKQWQWDSETRSHDAGQLVLGLTFLSRPFVMKAVAADWGEASPPSPLQTATSCSAWWAANSWPKSCEAVSHTQQWGYRRWVSMWPAGAHVRRKVSVWGMCVCVCVFHRQRGGVIGLLPQIRQSVSWGLLSSSRLQCLLSLAMSVRKLNSSLSAPFSSCSSSIWNTRRSYHAFFSSGFKVVVANGCKCVASRLRSCRGLSPSPAEAAGRPRDGQTSLPPPPQRDHRSEPRDAAGWPGGWQAV